MIDLFWFLIVIVSFVSGLLIGIAVMLPREDKWCSCGGYRDGISGNRLHFAECPRAASQSLLAHLSDDELVNGTMGMPVRPQVKRGR